MKETAVKLPAWAVPFLRIALSNVKVELKSVKRISEEFSFRGLMSSPISPRLGPRLNPAELLGDISAEAPVDGVEVVPWMHYAAVENAVLQARIAEYNALGSQVVGSSGDPYLPGLVVENIYAERARGNDVSARGYALIYTPRGAFRVPALSKNTGVFRDLLSWASISHIGAVQWVCSLLKWKELASTPIKKTVGFYMDSAGNTAPQFFIQTTKFPKPFVIVRQVYESSQDQEIKITYRDPEDYTRTITSQRIKIPSGTCEVLLTVFSIPHVPPMIAEIQPQNGVQTKLNEYVVF